jgi:5,6-dimethylbenzimidazole synthase
MVPSHEPAAGPVFDADFRRQLDLLLAWRRDVRRFRTDPLPDGAIDRLIDAACRAPSVGNCQPWRFVLVETPARRQAVRASFQRSNVQALAGYHGERAALYAGLKLAGLNDAPVQLAVFADLTTECGHGLGRATMPETVAYSVVTAIHTLWLVARTDGIGVGWVSILEPEILPALLDLPSAWQLVGYLCIGFPERESLVPELVQAGWQAADPQARQIWRR